MGEVEIESGEGKKKRARLENFALLPCLFSLLQRNSKPLLLTSRVPFAIFQQLDARNSAKRREERGELGLSGVVGELFFLCV